MLLGSILYNNESEWASVNDICVFGRINCYDSVKPLQAVNLHMPGNKVIFYYLS